MILIRSLVFNVAFYLSFILLMTLGLPTMIISRGSVLMVVRLWARVSLWLLATICGTKVEFRGLHNLPRGAAIIAPKHQSFLETIALIAVLSDFTYILKKELIAIPFFGWWLKASDQIAIDRSKGSGTLVQLQKAVREKLALGRQVVIFPEGTRKPIGAPPAYKTGVAILCADCAVPCTPVALNAGLFWPRRSMLRPPGTVVIEFLPAIDPGLEKRLFLLALETAIEPATNALVEEALRANPTLIYRQKIDPATA
jgi:1-acyl-sn-glycerol-3-phosphate acyltransferase